MFGFKRYFDQALFARTYRDPVSWASLAIDLFPLFAVAFLGWGGVAIVMLYWLENLIIGANAVARMIGRAVLSRDKSIAVWGAEFIGAIFISAYFILHYGLFTIIHGIFLQVIVSERQPDLFPHPFAQPSTLVQNAISVAPGMPHYVGLLCAWAAFLFVMDYVCGGEYKDTEISSEMVKPYGRVIVLHIGIFAAAAAMAAWGEPVWGVLALIFLRAVLGIFFAMGRKYRLET